MLPGQRKVPTPYLNALRHNLKHALDHGQLNEAGEILARLKKEDPLGKETRGLELNFYLRSNRIPEAAVLAEQLCRLFPDSARIQFLAGQAAYRQRRYGDAESRFRESHRLYPHWNTQRWLGKTLTQLGRYDDAEPLLTVAAEHADVALLDLAWLHERRRDFDGALAACEAFLRKEPRHEFAARQRLRLKAMALEPAALIEEMDRLEELGEVIPEELFPEYLQRLFQTGQSRRAREEVVSRMRIVDPKCAIRVAWICYHAMAYDLACTLFLQRLSANLADRKLLVALEAAAGRCNRIPEVLEAYRALLPQGHHLYGRVRNLSRRLRK